MYSLKSYNTFGIDVKTKEFTSVCSVEELKNTLKKHQNKEVFILGGGSNVLFTKDVEKPVIQINIKGIKITNQDQECVLVEAMAGENWHEFVVWAIKNNFGGIENLSLIPGNVGAAPIQNIGAYGMEIKDVFHSCKAINIKTLETKTFTREECNFGYRESIFKKEKKGEYVIVSVQLKLTRSNHKISTSYGIIQSELQHKNITNPTISDISQVVIAIRKNKLPDPIELGNSGSFFKNPIISKDFFEKIQQQHPEIPFYSVSEEEIKIPAGWLIEQIGFKGKRLEDAGVHQKQALVLVNYGKATGMEIYDLAKNIQQNVLKKFGITIETEVNIF